MRTLSYSVSTLVLASILSACATTDVESVRGKAAIEAKASLPDLPMNWQTVATEVGDVDVGWVAVFNDLVLSGLVAEAQANNRQLQVAAANVDRAQALARQAGAALSPQLGLSAGGGASGNLDGASLGNLNLGLQASWELDIWGRIQSGEQAAFESAEAARADYTYSQHSLAAAVSRAYFLAIEAKRQLELTQKIVDVLDDTRNIVQVQFDNGVANQQDLSLINSDVASARDSFEAAKGAGRNALRSLEVLLGRYPGADIDVRNSLPPIPAPPGAGIPSEILERRPDLVAAERRIASRINTVYQDKAAKLPSISLSSSLGGSSSALSSLLSPTNLAWKAASNLLLPISDGGRADAQVDLATADQRAAVATYAQTALQAFSEVETTLDAGVVLRNREIALTEAAKEAEIALNIAQLRFDEGETDLLNVLQIQQRLFSAEANQIAIERAQLDQFVSLNLALGGEWN